MQLLIRTDESRYAFASLCAGGMNSILRMGLIDEFRRLMVQGTLDDVQTWLDSLGLGRLRSLNQTDVSSGPSKDWIYALVNEVKPPIVTELFRKGESHV